MTREQSETIEMLSSEVEDLEVAEDPDFDDGWLVFEGAGQDGPSCGYIQPDGKVEWLSAG